jgi:hypothetical protein
LDRTFPCAGEWWPIVDRSPEAIQDPAQQLVTGGCRPAASLWHDARTVGDAGGAVEGDEECMLVPKANHFAVTATFNLDQRTQRNGRQLGFEHGTYSPNDAPRHMLQRGAFERLLKGI